MGIHDREYYRRGGSNLFGTLADQGQVTTGLIIANVICFVAQFTMRSVDPETSLAVESFTNALRLDANRVLRGEVWRVISYAFLHDTQSIFHILMNMLFLFWFGRQVEAVLGGKEFLRYFLLSATLAGLAFVLAAALGLHGPLAIGASGAVTAILVLAAFYNPRQVIYLFLILPIPIWGFIILNVVVDTFHLLGGSNSGVAASAHLGGAAFGYLYYKRSWRISGWLGWLPELRRPRVRSRPSLRVYREGEEPERPAPSRPTPSVRTEDEHLEAQVDAILEKIPKVGMEGLTEQERKILVRASEIMKRRRS